MLSGFGRRTDMLDEWARHDAATHSTFRAAMRARGVSLERARVLDVGCGSNAPMTVMLHSAGIAVVGIDDYVGYRWGLGFSAARYRRYCAEAGLPKTLRKLAGEIAYDRHYYNVLSQHAGLRLHDHGVDIRQMAAEHLAFESDSFDVVHSNATWEHILNVGAANAEIARVLRPGGVAYLEMHLFPSLSGGHDLPWIVPGKTELGDVVPWRHLRKRDWSAPVQLNRHREADYRRLFEATPGIEIVEWQTEFTEGEGLVTDDVLRDVPGYTREDLTKRSIVVTLRKRAMPASGDASARWSTAVA